MWQDYKAFVQQHTVMGDLRIQKSTHSPQLNNERDILVWLPPSYADSDKHYPVLYMHDGQNVFDAHTSYSGEWGVDETITALSAEGLEAIVVGIPNQGEQRRIEYNPYPTQVGEHFWDGSGDAYIAFITDTLKPMIDSTFRTHPEKAMTGIAGSSMGGLISLHGFLTRQDIFGFCGAFSPVFWTGLWGTITKQANGSGKIYIDIGGKEGEVILGIGSPLDVTLDEAHSIYLDGVRQLHLELIEKGYQPGKTLLYVEDDEALHNESAWALRLPDALRFLLTP